MPIRQSAMGQCQVVGHTILKFRAKVQIGDVNVRTISQ